MGLHDILTRPEHAKWDWLVKISQNQTPLWEAKTGYFIGQNVRGLLNLGKYSLKLNQMTIKFFFIIRILFFKGK